MKERAVVWMKVEHSTPDKPEVLAIASALSISPDEAFGVCFRMWRWFDMHTEDGNAPSVTTALLNRLLGVSGFAEAALAAGWLESCEIGGKPSLRLPNFNRHTGETAKQRALTAKRVADHKAKSNAKGNGKGNAAIVSEALPREEKRREEKNKKTRGVVSLADSLKTCEQVHIEISPVWHQWLTYKHERGDKLTETGLRSAVTHLNGKVAAHGSQAVAAAIVKAMASNWQGWDQNGTFDHKANGTTAKPQQKKYLA
jgi:hypothetical protein